MIKTKKLVEFYVSQYGFQMKKKQKNPVNYRDFNGRLGQLCRSVRAAKASRISRAALEDYHRQIKNITSYARRTKRRCRS